MQMLCISDTYDIVINDIRINRLVVNHPSGILVSYNYKLKSKVKQIGVFVQSIFHFVLGRDFVYCVTGLL